jgi:hypothetical protein
MLQIMFLRSSESSGLWGVHGLGSMTFGLVCKSSWIVNDFSLKIKLNRSWKFWRNWNVPLVLLERSWWAGVNGIYLVRFGFRMWEILVIKWFLLLKIPKKKKNTRFWKEISVEDVVTLGPVAQATLVMMNAVSVYWSSPKGSTKIQVVHRHFSMQLR